MKKINQHNKGFTFIEMVITIIIASIGTGTMMYVFNAAQTRYFNDQMENAIDTYCNDAVDFIATIVSRSDSTITKTSDNPPRYTIWKFNDKYTNQGSNDRADYQRKIIIEMNDRDGVIIKERNRNITGELYNKYMQRNHKKDMSGHYKAPRDEWNALAIQGLFNPGKDGGDGNILTRYVFIKEGFKIKEMDPGNINTDFFHNITDNRMRASLEKCTYDIEIAIEIQEKIDEKSLSDQLYKQKLYRKRAYCPSCYVRHRSYTESNMKKI